MRRISGTLLACGFTVLLGAQDGDATNPFTSAEDVAAGGRLFRSHCAVCHGETGSGDRGTDLTSGEFRHGGTDAAIRETIADGIRGTEMPGIFFEGKQLWRIVAYVRSLGASPNAPSCGGDALQGQALFEGKGGCPQCHQVNGTGGRSGPDLTDVGGRRSEKYLRASLLRPGDRVLPQDYRVTAQTKSGQTISGRRLNEDTFSIQLIDDSANLVSLAKADLTEFALDKKSAMPPYGGVLNESEITDVLAYLATLRRKGTAQ